MFIFLNKCVGGNKVKLNAAIKNMTTQIADVLSLNDPSVYIYGSYVLDDFQYGPKVYFRTTG